MFNKRIKILLIIDKRRTTQMNITKTEHKASLYPKLLLTTGFIIIHSLFYTTNVYASGISPDSSIIFIDERVGEASINIRNTDSDPVLLISAIYSLPEDDEEILIVTPPITRVEASETQTVRFMMQSSSPLKTQRLRRATFESIAPKDSATTSKVGMTIAHDIPVIVHPKDLKNDLKPWKHIKWSINKDQLIVENPSPYVVRLVPSAELLPISTTVLLPHSYILPGQRIAIDLPTGTKADSVKIDPANLYGYTPESFTARLE